MKTYTHNTNYADYSVPQTVDFDRSEFNSISHKVNVNKHDDNLASKYGSYSIDFDFAHDDYQTKTVVKGKELIRTGGIDLRLKSISNLKSKGKGLSTLKGSLRKADKSIQFVDDVIDFFKEELHKRKVNRKLPMFYTGSIKHKLSKRLLDNAATMIVEQEDCLLVYVVIGSVKYQFETKRGGNFTDKQDFCHSRFTAYNNDDLTVNWFEEDDFMIDDFEVDEPTPVRKRVTSSLTISYEIEPVTVEVTPEEAKEISRVIQEVEPTMTTQEAVNLFKRDFPEQYENWLSISDESVLTKEWFLTKLNAHIENGRLLRPTSMLNSINKHFAEYNKAKKAQREHQEAEQQFLKDISQ